MSTKTEMLACVRCKAVTPHRVEVPNHILHVILSVLTLGLWLFVWLCLVIAGGSKQCQECLVARQAANRAAMRR